ncbi:hypothetical protein KMW28_04790 [Flammeovirga yaeyamensis]|uniref:Uncharacterized protein n=1 Tax=Flammeovirga yaeyamensis TaxID=367791 RepID=A0AAX1N9I8_9BACT|nr:MULTISPECIES: hypothetical protein [Flammeovirga]ANQ49668.1 hypothetical protein MY04_2296 [Flammeovirga sp. MY04]MBB3697473.1 hypothetical protein [Flammeovirga yaeyamensis]NMF36167.1 hypothetical protein [Flammeovirga yaeyamensis]QWG02900.1 hypothetical protein KMW28_04790 [Flammeovirga yaeyamensis]
MNISSSFLVEVLKEKFQEFSVNADLVEGLRLAQVAHDGLSYDDQKDLKDFIVNQNMPHSEAIIEAIEKRVTLKSKLVELQKELDRLVAIQFDKDLNYNVENEINMYMDRIILLETCNINNN